MRLGNPGLAVDSRAEEDGIWHDCPNIWWPAPDRPMRVKVRSRQSRLYEVLLRKLTKGLSQEQLEEQAEKLAIELSVAIISGWENWVAVDGKEVPFSEETCSAILHNRDNRDMLNFINQCAADSRKFYLNNKVEAEKN